jgi:acetyl esterase
MPITTRTDRPRWKDRVIEIEGRSPIATRCYRATFDAAQPVALVLHLHGGAFVGGGLDQGAVVASLLARSGATVLSIAYPLAPEHPFPCAVEAAHAALAWMQRHRRHLGGGELPLMVAGEEAGGNLAAAIALMARDRYSPALSGQILLSPMLDLCVASASWRDALAARRAGQCPSAEAWRAYLPRACDAAHPYAAPSRSMRLQGLPPTLLITSQDDPLRDDALGYAQRLRQADVPVTQAVLPFVTGWPRSYLQPTQPAAPWTEAVLVHLRRFLHERRALFAGAQRAMTRGL